MPGRLLGRSEAPQSNSMRNGPEWNGLQLKTRIVNSLFGMNHQLRDTAWNHTKSPWLTNIASPVSTHLAAGVDICSHPTFASTQSTSTNWSNYHAIGKIAKHELTCILYNQHSKIWIHWIQKLETIKNQQPHPDTLRMQQAVLKPQVKYEHGWIPQRMPRMPVSPLAN